MLKYHMAGFRKAGAEVVAIADATPGVASKAAASWIVPAAYESVEEMFQRTPDLDAVSIIVPNKFHAPLAIQCLEAGKHVFCEKPPALHAGEVETMIGPGDAVVVKPGHEHVIRNTGAVRLYTLTVMIPNEGFAELIRSGLKASLDGLDLAALKGASM